MSQRKKAPRNTKKEPDEEWCRKSSDHKFIYKGCKRVRGRFEVTYECVKCGYTVTD